MFDKLRWSFYC